jgi:hypothetical protein
MEKKHGSGATGVKRPLVSSRTDYVRRYATYGRGKDNPTYLVQKVADNSLEKRLRRWVPNNRIGKSLHEKVAFTSTCISS